MMRTQVGLEGKGGARYNKWGGLCLMTQNYRLTIKITLALKIDKIHEILIILILVIIVIIVTPLIIVTIEGTPQASPPFPLLFSDQARPTGMQLSTGTH